MVLKGDIITMKGGCNMCPKQKKNTERINVFFSEDDIARIRDEAQLKGTTVSGMVRMIVLEYLNRTEK